MSALAKIEQENLPGIPEPEERPVTILDIINRAAFDPSVDADKIERLLKMAREFKADDAKTAYARAMIAMKPDLPVIDRKGRIVIHEKGKDRTDANIIQSTPYALWEDIDAAITPILAKHGFVLTFRTGAGAEGRITVTGILMHEMGHSEESTMPLPLDTSGSKNNVQAAGSSTSYGKRYTATALLNIRTKGEDDDGVAGDNGPISDEDMEWIKDMIERSHSDLEKFCTVVMKVDSLSKLTKRDMPKAREALNEALSYWQRKNPKAKA